MNTLRRKQVTNSPSLYFSDPGQVSKNTLTLLIIFYARNHSLVENNNHISVSYVGQQCSRFAESTGVTPLYFANTSQIAFL